MGTDGSAGPLRPRDSGEQRVTPLDLEYLRNWSVGLDLQILARTALRVGHDRAAF